MVIPIGIITGIVIRIGIGIVGHSYSNSYRIAGIGIGIVTGIVERMGAGNL